MITDGTVIKIMHIIHDDLIYDTRYVKHLMMLVSCKYWINLSERILWDPFQTSEESPTNSNQLGRLRVHACMGDEHLEWILWGRWGWPFSSCFSPRSCLPVSVLKCRVSLPYLSRFNNFFFINNLAVPKKLMFFYSFLIFGLVDCVFLKIRFCVSWETRENKPMKNDG